MAEKFVYHASMDASNAELLDEWRNARRDGSPTDHMAELLAADLAMKVPGALTHPAINILSRAACNLNALVLAGTPADQIVYILGLASAELDRLAAG
jgi:hypothetical protein